MSNKSNLEKAQIIFDILGKILIPIVVALLAILWGRYQNTLLQEEREHQNTLLQKEKEYELEQKYLQIFYADIVSETPARRKLAEAILKEMYPNLQSKLMRVFTSISPDRALFLSNNIADDTTQSPIIRTQAKKISLGIGEQFIIMAPSENQSVMRTVSVKGKTPYYNRTHYLVITPEGKGDFLQDTPLSVSSDGNFWTDATLGSAERGVGEKYTLRVIATSVNLTPEQIRSNTIPEDALSSNSVSVSRTE